MEKNTQTQLQFNGEHTDNDNNMKQNCDIVVIFRSFTIAHRKCFRNCEKKHLFGGTSHFPASLKLTFCQRQAVDGYTKKGSGSINGPLAGVPSIVFYGKKITQPWVRLDYRRINSPTSQIGSGTLGHLDLLHCLLLVGRDGSCLSLKALMAYCWWFRNPKQPLGMVLKPCK